MFAAEVVPMETDSAMVKLKHGRFDGRPVRRIVVRFVERYAREALLVVSLVVFSGVMPLM
jgi:hypothetical protein